LRVTIEQAMEAAVATGKRGELARAAEMLEQIVRQQPDYAVAWSNLANAYYELKRLDESASAARRAIALAPAQPIPRQILATTLIRAGRANEAVPVLADAVAAAPESAETHGDYARALLLTGDLHRGFAEFEWRWKCKSFSDPPRNYPLPQWRGEDVRGKRVFIHPEQGLGDTIQFIRYAPLLAERGATVIVESQREVAELIRRMPSVSQVTIRGEPPPPFDLHCPTMSLPLGFGTTLETIPANVPYLSPDPNLIGIWREKLAAESDALKVGICWAGRPTHNRDRFRSARLTDFAPLARIPNVRFYSLQHGEAAKQIANPPAGLNLIDHTASFRHFEDAALIANLDLVISVDTATAHLAGALAKPVWNLLSFQADWRWMLHRSDSPWYPTMKLFRQKTFGDWSSVFTDVAAALANQSR
jgi:hypothetical protein